MPTGFLLCSDVYRYMKHTWDKIMQHSPGYLNFSIDVISFWEEVSKFSVPPFIEICWGHLVFCLQIPEPITVFKYCTWGNCIKTIKYIFLFFDTPEWVFFSTTPPPNINEHVFLSLIPCYRIIKRRRPFVFKISSHTESIFKINVFNTLRGIRTFWSMCNDDAIIDKRYLR